MASTAGAFSSVTRNDGRTSCARCSNSRTASNPASAAADGAAIARAARARPGRSLRSRCRRPLFLRSPAADGEHDRHGSGGGRAGRARWQRQRRDLPAELALHAQGLPTGGQHGQGRAGGQQVFRQGRHGLGEVLAVVQHDQHPVPGEVLGGRLDRVLPRRVGHAELAGDRLGGHARILDLRQGHPARPGREGLLRRLRGGQRQPCLPRTPGSGQRNQPSTPQSYRDVVKLPLTAHQRGKAHWELRPGQRQVGPPSASSTGNATYQVSSLRRPVTRRTLDRIVHMMRIGYPP